MSRATIRSRAVLSSLALLAGYEAVAADIPPEPGDKWKVTMSMSAMGMNMPGRTTEVCSPRGSDSAPMDMDKNCQISDRQRSGNKETFRMRCTGKNAMEGTMEIEYLGRDHYRGKMLVNSKDGEMTMNYEGEKIGGECDAAEMKRKIAGLQAQSAAAIAKECGDAARSGQATLFIGATAMCKDPKDKQVFCATAQSHKGFLNLSRPDNVGVTQADGTAGQQVMPQSAAFCGFKVEQVRSQLCASAEGKGEWAFLAGQCPSIAQPLAQRECAGRDFTTPVAEKYRDFCSAYASEHRGSGGDGAGGDGAQSAGARGAGGAQSGGAQGTGTAPAAAPSATEQLKKNVDKLRGIFGR